MNPVIESLLPFEKHLRYVTISENFAPLIKFLGLDRAGFDHVKEIDWHHQGLNPVESGDQTTRWLFTVSALNFCFWQLDNTAYYIEMDQRRQSGYWALAAAIELGRRAGVDITNPRYVCSDQFTLQELRKAFVPCEGRDVPLLQRRYEILREVSGVLVENFGGDIVNLVKLAENSASKLAALIVQWFPCFRDECDLDITAQGLPADAAVQKMQDAKKTMHLRFYKRAQIFVAELFYSDPERYCFPDIDCITIFADYRIPQMLHRLGLISYTAELLALIQDPAHIVEAQSRVECEIRAASILAVYKLASATGARQVTVDFLLWNAFKHAQGGSLESFRGGQEIPMHRTPGYFY